MGFPRLGDGIRNRMAQLGIDSVHRYLTQDLWPWVNKLFRADNSLILPRIYNADADNDSIYYSLDSNKPVYKDDVGVVHNLY